jgi:hypothetical protein
LWSFTKEAWTAKRPSYLEEAFVLQVLRAADKSIIQQAKDEELAKRSCCYRVYYRISFAIYYSFQRYQNYHYTLIITPLK